MNIQVASPDRRWTAEIEVDNAETTTFGDPMRRFVPVIHEYALKVTSIDDLAKCISAIDSAVTLESLRANIREQFAGLMNLVEDR